MWSFNRSGEVGPRLKDEVYSAMGIRRDEAAEEVPRPCPARQPQRGVVALKSMFPDADGHHEDVRDADEDP